MKIFISWSGAVSQELGGIIKQWLYDTFHNAKLVYTPRYLKAGGQGTTELYTLLQEMDMGILVYTPESTGSEWMIFEAGAIHGRTKDAIIIPLIFEIDFKDLPAPIQAYQWKQFNREDLYDIFKAINKQLGEKGLEEERLRTVFDNRWSEMEARIETAVGNIGGKRVKKKKRTSKEMVEQDKEEREQDKEEKEQDKNKENAFIIILIVLFFYFLASTAR